MTHVIKIKKATVSDAKYIALLGRVTFGETFGDDFRDRQDLLDYYERTFTVEKIRQGIEKPNNIFWLAEYDGLPVGYGKLKINSASDLLSKGHQAQLQKIYILRDCLSMGIGAQIYYEMLNAAGEHHMESIWLSVLQKNQRAIRFYEKLDFVKNGQHDFIIGKEHFDFHIMVKDLT